MKTLRLVKVMSVHIALFMLAACAGRGEAPVVGVTHGMPQSSAKDAGAPPPAFVIDGGVDRTGLTRMSPDGYMSVGHASGRFSAEVYGNELALAIFKQPQGSTTPFPVGSVLVMTHEERRSEVAEGGTATGPTFRMQKTDAGWRYATVSKTGALLAEGTPEHCVACHEDAPRDHVFPLLPPR